MADELANLPALPKGWHLDVWNGNKTLVAVNGAGQVEYSPLELDPRALPGEFNAQLFDSFTALARQVANRRTNDRTVKKLIELWKDN